MELFLLKLSIMLVPGLMAVTCHEVSHGYIAYKFGDGTAKSLGRLTLNPIKHIDLVGALMLFVVGIGWAKPVPVNYGNLRNPKSDMIWVAAAGPITNFLLATLSALSLRFLVTSATGVAEGSLAASIIDPVILMLAFSVYINLVLGIFNLIPVPPLDGGRVAVGVLPYRPSMFLARMEPYGMLVIIGLVFFTDLFAYVLKPPLIFAVNLLSGEQSTLVMKFMGM